MHYVFAFILVLVAQVGHSATRNEVVISSLDVQAFSTITTGWKKIVDVYYNPEYTPVDLLAKSAFVNKYPDQRREKQTQQIENAIISQIQHINSKRSSFIGRYMGRTDRKCDDFSDDVIVICWSNTSADSYLGVTSISVNIDAETGAYFPIEAYIKLSSTGLSSRSYVEVLYVLQHELLHLVGLGHSHKGSMMYDVIQDMSPAMTRDDIEGLEYLYPVSEKCIPTIETMNSVPSFIAQVFYMGEIVRARFTYRDTDGLGSLEVTEFFEPDSDIQCTKKFLGSVPVIQVKSNLKVHTLVLIIVSEKSLQIISY